MDDRRVKRRRIDLDDQTEKDPVLHIREDSLRQQVLTKYIVTQDPKGSTSSSSSSTLVPLKVSLTVRSKSKIKLDTNRTQNQLKMTNYFSNSNKQNVQEE